MSRYDGRAIVRNQEMSYSDVLQSKDLKYIDQFSTPTISKVTTTEGLALTRVQHVWTYGDRLWKLADQYYGDPSYWWLIAWYNQKPTEAHFLLGDAITIPTPLERALAAYNKEA
jgi:nucleoid-associated protein YgaU